MMAEILEAINIIASLASFVLIILTRKEVGDVKDAVENLNEKFSADDDRQYEIDLNDRLGALQRMKFSPMNQRIDRRSRSSR